MDNRIVSLVIQFQKGSDEAFEKLYLEFSHEILKYLNFMTNNDALSLDISQEVWIKVINKKDSLKTPAAFKQWLYRIAKNTYFNHFNKNKKEIIESNLESIASESKEEDILINKEDLSIVQKIIYELPEDKRTIIWLRFVERYTSQEIAKIMKIPIGTLRSRLHYVIKEIKELAINGVLK